MEGELLHQLTVAAGNQQAAFCCGGTVRIAKSDNHLENQTTAAPNTSPPVLVRWDAPSSSTIRKLSFPPIEGAKGESTIGQLITDCTPATFGQNDKEVLDESYRHAGTLDSSDFSSNFSPHTSGIIAAIAQTLLPGIANRFSKEPSEFEEHLGVVAELYKLNIYSGPSGKFRAHVDTPRGATQFGSLVVCLPHPHKGGQLRVAHKGNELLYDWSNECSDEIGWAAFYSDCEHEVLQVESGHRVTLTYNLYVYEQLGGILRSNPTADPESYPLFAQAENALTHREFLEEGSTLGFYCTHFYAHTHDEFASRLPFALKGVDAMVYAVFRSLGLEVEIRPVMEDLRKYDYGEEYDSDRAGDLVGTKLHHVRLTEEGGYDDSGGTKDIVERVWGSDWRDDILWLNRRGPADLAVVHLAYGNEPSMEWHYSSAAILITVPPSSERQVASNPETT